jgi:hypothetical protein
MRLQDTENTEGYSKFILDVGNGVGAFENKVPLSIVNINRNVDDFIKNVYNQNMTRNEIIKSVILCPKNDQTEFLNEYITSKIPGQCEVYYSADSIIEESSATNYPTEFLNGLLPTGMPPHKLILKVGVPIILLRNFSQKKGLCNGTRLLITKLLRHSIEAEIATGMRIGEKVLIPRFQLCQTETRFPFHLIRRQFPIRIAFAMTINKAQGQTLDSVGIYLTNSVFTHGQLYVALSRVKNPKKVFVYLPKGDSTNNVVYKEIFE